MMEKEKVTLKKEVEDTMACSAYAEAGEPCPIGGKEKEKAVQPETAEHKKMKKSVLEKVADDFACTAFHDHDENCPIGGGKEE